MNHGYLGTYINASSTKLLDGLPVSSESGDGHKVLVAKLAAENVDRLPAQGFQCLNVNIPKLGTLKYIYKNFIFTDLVLV